MPTETVAKLPHLVTALPGPNAKKILELDDGIYFAVVHARLSAGGEVRTRCDD